MLKSGASNFWQLPDIFIQETMPLQPKQHQHRCQVPRQHKLHLRAWTPRSFSRLAGGQTLLTGAFTASAAAAACLRRGGLRQAWHAQRARGHRGLRAESGLGSFLEPDPDFQELEDSLAFFHVADRTGGDLPGGQIADAEEQKRNVEAALSSDGDTDGDAEDVDADESQDAAWDHGADEVPVDEVEDFPESRGWDEVPRLAHDMDSILTPATKISMPETSSDMSVNLLPNGRADVCLKGDWQEGLGWSGLVIGPLEKVATDLSHLLISSALHGAVETEELWAFQTADSPGLYFVELEKTLERLKGKCGPASLWSNAELEASLGSLVKTCRSLVPVVPGSVVVQVVVLSTGGPVYSCGSLVLVAVLSPAPASGSSSESHPLSCLSPIL